MKKIISLYKKFKMQINYLLFGIITTIVNILCYVIFYNLFNVSNVTSTIIAWFGAVVTAYITNKLYVFESRSFKPQILFKEITSFFGGRIATGVIDVFIMWISVDILLFNSTLIKIISNIIVIILNYIISKLIVFKR